MIGTAGNQAQWEHVQEEFPELLDIMEENYRRVMREENEGGATINRRANRPPEARGE